MADLLTQTLGPSDAGLNSDAAAHAMPRGQAPTHRNFLLHQPGAMPMRGPIVNHTELSHSSTPRVLAGVWRFQDILLVCRANTDATATNEPWSVPFRPTTSGLTLAVANGTMKEVSLNALTVTDRTPANSTYCVSGRGAALGAYVYGFAYNNIATYSIFGQLQWKRKFIRWDVIGASFTQMTGAPEAGQDVITHLNRIWVLGGVNIADGGTAIQPNTLYFSDVGGPVANAATDWKDDATGLANQIVVDSDDPTDFGVGLAKIGEDLMIFKRHSIHVLSGYSAATFTLRPITHDIGCIDRRSIVESSEGVYFMSDSGYMYYDGTDILPIGENLGTSLNVAATNTVGSAGVDGGRCVAGKLLDNYILVSCAAQNFNTPSTVTQTFAAMLHTPTGHWTEFSSNALNGGGGAGTVPYWVGRTMNHAVILDDRNVIKVNEITRPEEAAESARGFDQVTRASSAVKGRIPSRWKSPLMPLSTPPLYAQFHRALIDYVWQVDGGSDEATTAGSGWYVTWYDATGSTVLAEYQLPAMGDPSSFLYRRRDVRDVYSESSDCQVVVEWRDSGGTYPAIIKAELYDVTAEFSRARQRRSS